MLTSVIACKTSSLLGHRSVTSDRAKHQVLPCTYQPIQSLTNAAMCTAQNTAICLLEHKSALVTGLTLIILHEYIQSCAILDKSCPSK